MGVGVRGKVLERLKEVEGERQRGGVRQSERELVSVSESSGNSMFLLIKDRMICRLAENITHARTHARTCACTKKHTRCNLPWQMRHLSDTESCPMTARRQQSADVHTHTHTQTAHAACQDVRVCVILSRVLYH